MAARFDAHTPDDHGPTETAPTFDHAPVGTPRGVVVLIAQNTSTTDQVTGVTYGGDSLTRVGSYVDTAGEPGRVYAYFLGSSVPTGTQAFVVNYATPAGGKRVRCVTLTGGADLELVDEGGIDVDTANPSIVLATASDFDGVVMGMIHSGHDAPTSITLGGSFTELGTGRDFGGQSEKSEYREGALGENAAVGFTATEEDAAMIALAVAEVAAAGPSHQGSWRFSP